MSKNTIKKTAGKIFAAFTFILLAAVLAVSAYIGGQTRAAEKHFSALASGDYPNYESTVSKYRENSYSLNDDFKSKCRYYFEQLPEFEGLEKNDVITAKIKIKERRMSGSPVKWLLIADVDFYSGGMSISYKDMELEAIFDEGKWLIFHDLKTFGLT